MAKTLTASQTLGLYVSIREALNYSTPHIVDIEKPDGKIAKQNIPEPAVFKAATRFNLVRTQDGLKSHAVAYEETRNETIRRIKTTPIADQGDPVEFVTKGDAELNTLAQTPVELDRFYPISEEAYLAEIATLPLKDEVLAHLLLMIDQPVPAS